MAWNLQEKRKFIGIVVSENGKVFFKNKYGDLFEIPQTEFNKQLCKSGKLCICEAISTNSDDFSFGNIIDVVGDLGDPIPEGQAIARAYDLPKSTKKETLDEVALISPFVTDNQMADVRDLRDIPFVTIDPDTAKDYDDAVFACKNPDGSYTLKVAIANVASYIGKNSQLFEHAMERGNSSYLGDTCYPMLMEELSNGICSLNENQDRLVMCTTCTILPTGELVDYKIEPAVIRSKHRLTYKEADYIYFGENAKGDDVDHSEILSKVGDVTDSLDYLYEVATILYKARMKRGAFDINSNKLEYKLDESKTQVLSYSREHNEAFTSVIEETAILANEIWGEVASKYHLPFIYRNHRNIDPERIDELQGKLMPYGIKVPKPCTTKQIQSIINKVQGMSIEEYVVSTILKMMESAYYDIENVGHAGLAILGDVDVKSHRQLYNYRNEPTNDEARSRYFRETGKSNGLSFEGDISHSAYVHSTSPIRRGSDLINQMQLLNFINNGQALFGDYEIAERCDKLNFCERNSARAENEYNTMLSALWASEHIGEIYHGCVITDTSHNETKIIAPNGYRMCLPQNYRGVKKKDLKIGKKLEPIVIDQVSLFPPKVMGCRKSVKDSESLMSEEAESGKYC